MTKIANMEAILSRKIPHPFPYQGSKRNIAKFILPYFPSNINCLIEPFCGASAISIAAAAHGLASKFYINDINEPLIDLWVEILERPEELCDRYEKMWIEQQPDRKDYFFGVRKEFNESHDPHLLLYLLARIVKGAVRYSLDGRFTQSADNRRSGMNPKTLRQNILGVSALLRKNTKTSSVDFRDVLSQAGKNDLVYMDPPYQGTSFTSDHRYFNGLAYDDFVRSLEELNDRNISYIISYDGTTGEKTYGKLLPESLSLKHLYINAGRSSQATFLGRDQETLESLYISEALVKRLNGGSRNKAHADVVQNSQHDLAFL